MTARYGHAVTACPAIRDRCPPIARTLVRLGGWHAVRTQLRGRSVAGRLVVTGPGHDRTMRDTADPDPLRARAEAEILRRSRVMAGDRSAALEVVPITGTIPSYNAPGPPAETPDPYNAH